MRFWIMASAMLVALSASAQAQRYNPNVRPIPLPHVALIMTAGQSFAQTGGAHGTVTTAADRPIGAVSALSMFSLNFENGDHKFRRMQAIVAPGNTSAQFSLNDLGIDDPFTGRARWVNISGGGTALSVTGRGGGGAITQLRIPAGPADTTFVLRGFEFARNPGTDANIRTMSIKLGAGHDTIDVRLTDDEHPDFRRLPLIPAGARSPIPGRPYRVTVQYAWVPTMLVTGAGVVTGNERARDAASVPAGLAALTGFSFEFNNSDHYLMWAGIDLADGGSAHFQDSNLDDPMRWEADYVTFRGS